MQNKKRKLMGLSRLRLAMVAVLLAFALAPAAAFAEACTSKSCSSIISKLYVPTGGILVRPKDGGQSNLNCTPRSGVYLTLRKSHPNFKEIYSALLSAVLANRAITMRIVDGSNGCDITYVTINN